MREQGSNLIATKRVKPVVNKANYKAIIASSLNSVSRFSETSIVAPELNSTSQPSFVANEEKREA